MSSTEIKKNNFLTSETRQTLGFKSFECILFIGTRYRDASLTKNPTSEWIMINSNNNNNNNDNNNNRTEKRKSRFLQSPCCQPLAAPRTVSNTYAQRSGSNRVHITRNTSSAHHVLHVVCHVVRRDGSAIKFDRV